MQINTEEILAHILFKLLICREYILAVMTEVLTIISLCIMLQVKINIGIYSSENGYLS